MQLDWKQQHAADLSRHQKESKLALSKLSSSVQQLEDKLHEAMAWQVCSSSRHAGVRRPPAHSGKHSCSSSVAEGGLTSAHKPSASKTSSVCLEDSDAEQIALASKAKHIATWVQQSTMTDRREDYEPDVSSSVPAEHSGLQELCQEANTAAALDRQDLLVSCHLTHQDLNVSVEICINAQHDSAEQLQQQAAQTRYSKWLTAVGVVEDASEQLKVRNHNPGPGAKPVSYAQLLVDCAASAVM
ncbi:hypothetical protein ABBQ38_010108 [Trebouxia sp. C0009 RCD-2024]